MDYLTSINENLMFFLLAYLYSMFINNRLIFCLWYAYAYKTYKYIWKLANTSLTLNLLTYSKRNSLYYVTDINLLTELQFLRHDVAILC